ncbi:hypothetical protein EIK77_010609 [Talaromyces pinophilus]|nr:hypothetical protein EIK77_010609 [Talaromyces pinophilus]
MPSFLGYAAYCACAIQMPFLWCTRPEVKQQAHVNVVTNLNVILIIGKIWKFVQLLGTHARRLYETHALQPLNITDEPKNISASILNEFRLGSARTRLSILAHNHIAINGEGVLANRIEDVDDVGLGNTATATGSEGDDESSISELISRINSDDAVEQGCNPVALNAMPFDSLPDLYDTENPGAILDMGQPDLIDEWIEQLMHQISS